MLLKVLAKSNLFAVALKTKGESDNYCYCDNWKSNKYKKINKGKRQRNYTKNQANMRRQFKIFNKVLCTMYQNFYFSHSIGILNTLL